MCGASHVLRQVVTIDADIFKTALPEWDGYVRRDALSAGYHTRQESGMLCEIAQEMALRDGKHIWVDGSLRDHAFYKEFFGRLRKERPNYRLAILHITAPEETVQRRVAASGRPCSPWAPQRSSRANAEEQRR